MDKLDKTMLCAAGALALGCLLTARRTRSIDFRGKSVIISGGSRGLGLVLARRFAEEGADLTLLARGEEALEAAAAELRAYGGHVLALPCDMRDRTEVEEAVHAAFDYHGRVDVLVNNAGMVQVGPSEHMAVSDYEEAMGVHFWGPLYAMLAAIPLMKHGGGRIVNIASIGGKVAVPHMIPYSASKFALVGLSDGMRAELAKYGIKVTTVIPGLMRTGSYPNIKVKGRHKAEFAWFALSDSLPFTSMDAREAAERIVHACRRGEPRLILTPQAKLAVYLNELFPVFAATAAKLANRLLPDPTQGGDEPHSGWESMSRIAPSAFTRLSDEAVIRNNQLHARQAKGAAIPWR